MSVKTYIYWKQKNKINFYANAFNLHKKYDKKKITLIINRTGKIASDKVFKDLGKFENSIFFCPEVVRTRVSCYLS